MIGCSVIFLEDLIWEKQVQRFGHFDENLQVLMGVY